MSPKKRTLDLVLSFPAELAPGSVWVMMVIPGEKLVYSVSWANLTLREDTYDSLWTDFRCHEIHLGRQLDDQALVDILEFPNSDDLLRGYLQ